MDYYFFFHLPLLWRMENRKCVDLEMQLWCLMLAEKSWSSETSWLHCFLFTRLPSQMKMYYTLWYVLSELSSFVFLFLSHFQAELTKATDSIFCLAEISTIQLLKTSDYCFSSLSQDLDHSSL